jgi:hypothetical protein
LVLEASRSFLPDLALFTMQSSVRLSGEKFYSFGIGNNFSGKKDGRPERCRNPRQHPSEPPTHLLEGEHYPTKNKSSETAEITCKLRKNIIGLE